jgi:long-subunit acyl-CoA synthetase (AMP-forming)
MDTTTTARPATRPAALEAETLCEAFGRTAAEREGETALRTLGDEVAITWREYAERVRDLAAGLAALGLGRGDALALMLVNRPEFHLVDTAVLHLGGVPFSIYNTSSPEQIAYLLGDAGNRIVVTERAFLPRILEARSQLAAIEHVVVVDGEGEDGTLDLADVAARGEPGFDFEATWRSVRPSDLATLIYTSGTTGPPKGVQLTHRNLVLEARALHEVMPLSGGRAISYLPSAHIADRMLSQYGSIMFGWGVTCCPDPSRVAAHLPDTRPTMWGAVPRVWEKLKAALEAGFQAEPDEDRRAAIRWALDTGLRRVRAEQAGEAVPDDLREEHARAEELVLSRLRARLGLDAVEISLVGAAPTPLEVLEFFAALGIPICEVWGMSETSAIATMNPPEAIRLGTVGTPIPGVELKLLDDGEVLVRSEMNMPGYRNLPDRTAETIDSEGWLHTGDVGEIDPDGYLRIVDRKKELIINAAGKNMSPANIEARLKESSPLIGQAVCIGDARPYNTALLVLDPDGAGAFASEHGLEGLELEALAREQAVLDEVAAAVERANGRLSRVEQIKRFRLLEADWEPGGDELTPTMKLKRRPIAEKYAGEIESLYA